MSKEKRLPADSYMAEDVLNKNRIPFIEVHRLVSLKKLLTYEHDIIGAVPSHGVFENHFLKTVQVHIQLHEAELAKLEDYIKAHETKRPMALGAIVATFSDVCQVEPGRFPFGRSIVPPSRLI